MPSKSNSVLKKLHDDNVESVAAARTEEKPSWCKKAAHPFANTVKLREAEKHMLEIWAQDFSSLTIVDEDGDGNMTPQDIFMRAEKKLNSLVSLGVIAGLLAGTSLATLELDFPDTKLSKHLQSWSHTCSLSSCSLSIGVSILIAYQYYNGMKLLSKGYLTVQLFIAKTDFMKRLCVKGFVSAAFLQLITLIVVTVCRLEERVTLIGEIIGVLVSLGVFMVVLAAMRVDMHTYTVRPYWCVWRRYLRYRNFNPPMQFSA